VALATRGGHVVVDHHQARRVAFQARAAGQQGLGVVVARVFKDARHGPLFADAAVAHHHHLIGDFAHQAQVVADEEHAHAALGLELAQQFQDLPLDGHVQRRGGLVGDQSLGSQARAIAIITRCCWPPLISCG
jgi:hypothetical protein